MDNTSKQSDLSKTIREYVKHWKLFLLSFFVCGVVAVAYLLIKNPEFEISANVLIKEDSKSGGMGGMASALMKNFAFSDVLGNVGGGVVDDELEIIGSYSVRYNTVKRLQLNKTFVEGVVKKKYYYGDSPIDINPVNADMADTLSFPIQFKVKVSKKEPDKVKVKAEFDGDEVGAAEGNFPIVIKTEYGDFNVTKTPYFPKDKKVDLKVIFFGYGYSAERLGKLVTVKLASKKANVINLIMEDINKVKGKDVLNTMIDEYNDYGVIEKNVTAERTAAFLQKRITIIDNDLKNTERILEQYKTENNLTDIEAEAKIILEKTSDFKEKLINAETQYSVISVIEEFLMAPENKYAVVPMSLGIDEKSAVESLLQYNELLLERLKLLRSTNPGNPVIESMNEQVDATRESVLATIRSIKRGIEYARNDLRMQEQEFRNRISGMPTQEREFIEIKRQQEIKQALFLFLLQKQEENELTLASANPKAQIIDSAFAKTEPISPVKLFVVALWGIFGLLLPIGYLYGRKLLDPKLYSSDDLSAVSGLPVVAQIHQDTDKERTNAGDCGNVVAEDIRNLRAFMLNALGDEDKCKTVLFASMADGEGKSYIASRTALYLAQTGRKVLLVDADFRCDEKQSTDAGLYQLLDGNGKLDDVIVAENSGLDVLRRGRVGELSAEMLQNREMEKLHEKLSERYDFIIFDSSALAKYSDAMPLVKLADFVLFVAREGYTTKHSLEYIASVVEMTSKKNAACIMNGVKD